jgi:hypothetical protein
LETGEFSGRGNRIRMAEVGLDILYEGLVCARLGVRPASGRHGAATIMIAVGSVADD